MEHSLVSRLLTDNVRSRVREIVINAQRVDYRGDRIYSAQQIEDKIFDLLSDLLTSERRS